ncbi:uncharacterized protein [Brachionichthys hirsutus]|uniref:uncharacterized protein n=1 Tax=Brachionichthys hirsutus TaxID=412623 RepID=UPI00360535E2
MQEDHRVRRGGKYKAPPIRSLKEAKILRKWIPFDACFCLLSSKTDTTPPPSEELQLIQAGLGKRTLSITSDFTHTQISSSLKEAYPKMDILEDRWILFKATGGNGRRKMSSIALEAEGYTGSIIKRASGGGKFVLYVVPLQDDLDLTPLTADAPEFALMPKATCKQCKTVMPLQMLALHIDHCSCTSDVEEEESDILILDEATSPGSDSDVPQSSEELYIQQVHEEDVLQWLTTQIDRSKTFEICVSRDSIIDRGLKLWKRQKNGGPENPLKVSFLGEPGVDTGALRKEFLSTMVAGIEKRLFEGESEKGKVPKYSLNDLDDELFKVAGEIFAVSIAQGGPAPRFLQEWCYHYLVTGNIKTEGFHDIELSPVIKTLEDASDLSPYVNEILDYGYTGPINTEHKERIIRAVVLHATTKRTPMLQQIREGLKMYNLIEVMQTRPTECHDLFVTGCDGKVDSHYILSHLAPEMSPRGSAKHMLESRMLEYLQDLLLELEDEQSEDDEGGTPSVPAVMQWMTGQAHKHLFLSEREQFKIVIIFDHNCEAHMPGHTICYPVVSACTNTLTLPTAHLGDYLSFKTNLLTAIKFGTSFDRV